MRAPERLEIEALLCVGSTRGAKRAAFGWVGDQARERSGEGGRIAWWNEDAGLAVDDQLRHASDASGDHREAGGHRFEHGDRHSLRGAGEDEDVRIREQLRNVVALAEQPDPLGEAERADLLLEPRAVRALAHDQRLGAIRERARRANECEEVLRRLEPAHGDDPRLRALMARPWSAGDVDGVGDHDRSLRVAGAGCDSGPPLALRDADRDRRQRLDDAVAPVVEPPLEARVGGERPAVDGEDPDGNAGQARGQAAEHAGLRAVRVQDVGPFAAKDADQLDETGQISPRIDPTADMFKRDVGGPQRSRSLTKGAHPVGRDDDVEISSQGRKQRGDVGLRSPDLGERDQHEHARAPLDGS